MASRIRIKITTDNVFDMDCANKKAFEAGLYCSEVESIGFLLRMYVVTDSASEVTVLEQFYLTLGKPIHAVVQRVTKDGWR